MSPNSILQIIETSPSLTSEPSQPSVEKETVEEVTEVKPELTSIYPILTKKGYHCSPSIETLSKYVEEELKHVERFSIWVEDVGKIEWEEPVDLCGLNLDELVTIERQNGSSIIEVVFVEMSKGQILKPEEGSGYKEMPPGSGINCKAKLTFNNVFPKTSMDHTRFVNLLKRKAEKLDAEFVDYDSIDGKWVIRVHHI